MYLRLIICVIYRVDNLFGRGRGRIGCVRVARRRRRFILDRRDVSSRRAGRFAQQSDSRTGQPQQHRTELPESVRWPTASGDASVERSRFESRQRSFDVCLNTM